MLLTDAKYEFISPGLNHVCQLTYVTITWQDKDEKGRFRKKGTERYKKEQIEQEEQSEKKAKKKAWKIRKKHTMHRAFNAF